MCMGLRMWQSSWGRGIPDSILVLLTVLGRGVRGSMCTGVLLSWVLGVFGSWLYGGAVGPRGLLASALDARAPSASCPSPARALAAASVAARAGRCGASRCPLLAVAITILPGERKDKIIRTHTRTHVHTRTHTHTHTCPRAPAARCHAAAPAPPPPAGPSLASRSALSPRPSSARRGRSCARLPSRASSRDPRARPAPPRTRK